jgi:hypothetical protein
MAQNWLNADGLFIQFGADKAIPETAGEFTFEGPNRIIEVLIPQTTLTSLTATPLIISNTTIFPAPPTGQLIIEKVELVVETGVTGASTLSVGLIQMDRATIPSGYSTALINAETQAHMASAGSVIEYFGATSIPAGGAQGGSLLGTQPANATGPYYITATGTATAFTAGAVRIRVFYRGLPPITQ